MSKKKGGGSFETVNTKQAGRNGAAVPAGDNAAHAKKWDAITADLADRDKGSVNYGNGKTIGAGTKARVKIVGGNS